MNGYDLSKSWFDFAFENPDKVRPNHAALFFFCIELCNRLGWKEKFGLPTDMAKDAIGIKNYRTYINTLKDLSEWGFIKMIERSTNQYTCNTIAIVENTKAHTKALSKAMSKHVPKQVQSIDSIDKLLNNTETIQETTNGFFYFGYACNHKMPDLPSEDHQIRWVIRNCERAHHDWNVVVDAIRYTTDEEKRTTWKLFYDQTTLELKAHLKP